MHLSIVEVIDAVREKINISFAQRTILHYETQRFGFSDLTCKSLHASTLGHMSMYSKASTSGSIASIGGWK